MGPNNSFKPTRIGAPPGCFSATLAPSRYPATGRLNSSVRQMSRDNRN